MFAVCRIYKFCILLSIFILKYLSEEISQNRQIIHVREAYTNQNTNHLLLSLEISMKRDKKRVSKTLLRTSIWLETGITEYGLMTSHVRVPRLERRARRIQLCIKTLTRSSAIQVWAFISLMLLYYRSWVWYDWKACIPHFKLIWHLPWICYHGMRMTPEYGAKSKVKCCKMHW